MLLVHNVQQEQMQLEEYVLKFAIDYSTDAAVEEMLSMSHLGRIRRSGAYKCRPRGGAYNLYQSHVHEL